jgi:hypothetical protein
MNCRIQNVKFCSDVYTADGVLVARRDEYLTDELFKHLWPAGEISGTIIEIGKKQKGSAGPNGNCDVSIA